MKTKIIAAVIALSTLVACKDDAPDPSNQMGCLTGIPKNGTERVLIRCATRVQYEYGSNVAQGGTASWNDYTSHQWAVCSDCK